MQIEGDPNIKFFKWNRNLDANLITNGGRVLTISGIGENKDALRDLVYEKMSLVNLKGNTIVMTLDL